MPINASVIISCEVCSNEIGPEVPECFLCEECVDKNIITHFKDAVLDAYSHYHNLQSNKFEGLETEKEKKIYAAGLRMGFFDALFGICNYWEGELIELWEKLVDKEDKNGHQKQSI